MSTEDIVAEDYGLSSGAPISGEKKERRIWRTLNVAPDPHKAGYFYVVQELAGEWRRGKLRTIGDHSWIAVDPESPNVLWIERDLDLPPVTRVLYCTMNKYGAMVNVNREASQGRTAESSYV